MVGKLYRTQILLEPAQHRELSAIAKREGRSVSDLIREILKNQLEQRRTDNQAATKRKLDALEGIRKFREEVLRENNGQPLDFDVVEALNQTREEQDERNWSILARPGD
ncbi:MAG TPA: ribbon-helix-helix protein, CopG family [Chloroflexia bacterium]|jgi:predicted CopG family antitoxin|nr:ribbon-helix-helix protein, CopG family [Chloroflexia bacterium]